MQYVHCVDWMLQLQVTSGIIKFVHRGDYKSVISSVALNSLEWRQPTIIMNSKWNWDYTYIVLFYHCHGTQKHFAKASHLPIHAHIHTPIMTSNLSSYSVLQQRRR